MTILQPSASAFVRQSVTVRAEATDGGSGVASLALSTDVAPLTTVLTPSPPAATVTGTAVWNTTSVADGTHTLSAIATDRAGNSRTVTRTVIVDNSAPDTQIVSGPSGDVEDTSVVFTFTGSDNLTPVTNLAFAWRLDGGGIRPVLDGDHRERDRTCRGQPHIRSKAPRPGRQRGPDAGRADLHGQPATLRRDAQPTGGLSARW